MLWRAAVPLSARGTHWVVEECADIFGMAVADGPRSLVTSARGRCSKPRRFFCAGAESDEEVSEGSNKRRKHHNPWCAPRPHPHTGSALTLTHPSFACRQWQASTPVLRLAGRECLCPPSKMRYCMSIEEVICAHKKLLSRFVWLFTLF